MKKRRNEMNKKGNKGYEGNFLISLFLYFLISPDFLYFLFSRRIIR
jgi:hypothetical protein